MLLVPGAVVGPGAQLTEGQKASLARWLEGGGQLLAVGLEEKALAGLVPELLSTQVAEHIASFFEPPGMASPLAGVAPADVHNRDPRSMPLISGGANPLGGGVLAASARGREVFCQLVPWQFHSATPSSQKRTFRRTAFLLSRLLANLGAESNTPLLERIATPVAAEVNPRFQSGFYLDQPAEWDDPYRFFRW